MVTRTVPRPPFPPALLADLHAGNVTAAQRERWWPIVSRDPEASRYLRGLDEVSAELGALNRDERVVHTMPEDVAARLARLIDTLPAPEDGPVHAHRRTRARRFATAAAVIVTVAAAGSVIAPMDGRDAPVPTAQLAIGDDELTATMALGTLGRHTVTGPLADPEALRRCVHANGLDRAVLGSADIAFRGGDAVLVLLNGPRPPAITVLVVGTGCATGDPQRKVVQDIG
ncbi:hypothetical protein [Nocardia beijingensis]|uniref:Anti-sigma-M factor RsmA n=1 Tax=Nocardia beijingensis TaxID=95162 RepID=A0ABW7WNJ8_9NOCA